jgi:acetylglutamate/LysW-gamma-L-alpha-aminoadipate kinase
MSASKDERPIVVKVGGSAGIDLDRFADDVARLVAEGRPLVVVHGGSAETNAVAEALGHPPRFVTSPSGFTSRYTDRRTLEIFEMVYCGSVNKGLVERLQQRGVDAVGLSGMDGRLWTGPRKEAIRALEKGRVRMIRDSLTGTVEKVNVTLLRALMAAGHLPVLTPPALSNDGVAINVDGDRAAAATAAALEADTLLLLSNVPGLLRRFPDEGSLVPTLARGAIDDALEWAEGRMRIKLLGAREALEGGVARVVLGDARIERPIERALAGAGTTIT